jgi:hypothetical protein
LISGIISGWNAAVLCGLRGTMRRRIFKAIRITVITILVMFFTAFFAVRHPSVQTYLVQAITQRLSEELGTEVRVQSVELDLFSRLVIRGLYVADHHQDTLLFVPAVRLRNYSFNRNTGDLSVRHAELQSPYFRLVRYEGETALNMAFIIDHFSKGTPEDSTAGSDIRISDVRIRDGRFKYLNYNREEKEEGIDWNRLILSGLHLDVDELVSSKDSLGAYLSDLSFVEKSGFELKGFSSGVTAVPGEVRFAQANLTTPRSNIRGDLSFQFNSIEELEDFERSVGMRHDLRQSVVELGDIGYFTESLRGIEKSLVVSGKFRGKVANLKGRDVTIRFDKNSWFKGAFHMDGLPEIDETFITCDVKEFATNAAELRNIPVPPFGEGNMLEIPDNMDELGDIRFQGNFTGFINDFVAYGTLVTGIGTLNSDIALKDDPAAGDYVYTGSFGAVDFDLGKFAGDPSLGKITAELNIDGKGLSLERMDASLDGMIRSITFNGYTLTNIETDGAIKNRFFDGFCSVDDPHLIVDFLGQVDFRSKSPELHFTADVMHMDLRALGILPDFPYSAISGNVEINSVGIDPDQFDGSIEVKNLVYCSEKRDYAINRFKITALRGETSLITLDSDVATGYVQGNFKVSELAPSFEKIVANVVPSYKPEIRAHEPQTFAMRLDVLDFSYFSEIFVPELSIAPKTRISLEVDEGNSDLTLNMFSDSIRYKETILRGMVLDARRPDQSIYLTLSAEMLDAGSGVRFPAFSLDAHTDADSVFTDIAWGGAEDVHQGDVKGKLTIRGQENLSFLFAQSSLRVNKDNWVITGGSDVMMDSTRVEVPGFSLVNGNQRMDIQGVISENPLDEMQVNLSAFDLALFNPFIGEETRLSGTLSGTSSARDVYHTLISNNDLYLIDFGINDYKIGDVCVESTWDNESKRLRLEGDIEKDKFKSLRFNGYYTPANTESPLDLMAYVDDLDLSFISAFMDEEVLGIRGFATGELEVKGTFDAPELEGSAALRDAWVKVPYLNCSYQVMGKLGVFPDMFTFDYIPIKDEEGNPGRLTGQLIHKAFGDWSYDLVMDIEKPFLAMNTTEEMNSLYYGKAYCTGVVSVYGYDEFLEIDVNARTEKGTRMSMPMNSTEEQSFASFIRFVNEENEQEESPMDLSGIKMNFELDITPDAEFQIIFDEAVGDVMKGRGKGHLNMEINNLSTFNMYGTVELVSGDYLFTLKNLLNKEFTVRPGGTISWFGDPFAADLNMEAIYKVSASLYDLMPDAVTQTGQRTPVDLVMKLNGKMLNPGINFDVSLPTVDEITRSRVASIISTDQERNRQAFSLLVLRRFVTPPHITADRTASGNALAENSTELLSSQISNWLSQISDDFNLGFNYRPGDEISNEEIALALSTQLFNERLSISGNFGVRRGNEANQNPTNYIGDIRVEYKITRDGKIRLMVYNESNDFRTAATQQAPYTQGVGVLYQEEFDTWDQFMCGFTQLFVPEGKRKACL